MRVNWFLQLKGSLEVVSFQGKQKSCKVFPTQYKSWETFFSRRKDSGRNLTKHVKFLKEPSSKLFRSPREKDTANWKREENYSCLWKPHTRNLKQKKEKRKENFEFRFHIGISIKKKFCNVQLFFVSVKCQVSPFDFPILSFYFIFLH